MELVTVMGGSLPTIVVVDDHDAGRYARAQVLRRAGFKVVEGSTGREALDLVERVKPGLVVLDVQLPDISGLEVCRRLKSDSNTAVIPVLHMSATSVSEPDQVRGLEGGADGYLVEPVAPEVIVATVKALLRMRAAEEELRESRRAMAALISTLPGMAYRRREADWEMAFVSEGARELSGYAPDEFVSGQILWTRVIHPADVGRVRTEAQSAARDGRAWESTYRIVSRDGVIKWVWDRATAVVNSEGARHWEGFATDITDRKRAQEVLSRQREDLIQMVQERTTELERSYEQLRLSERMASLGTLSAGIGHDIANLLLPMRCHLDVIEGHEEASEDIRAIRASVDYLQNLVGALRLLVVDPEPGTASPVTDLGEWWRTVQPLLRSVLPRTVELEHDVPERLQPAVVPKASLAQAVFNLVQNAGDALKERTDGRVGVRAEAIPGENGAPGRVRISVSDNGPGMSAETKRRCLEPFFTTKARDRSTGLGLSLVYSVVVRAGGTLDIRTAEGAGTTIVLEFPATDAPAHPAPRDGGTAVVSIADDRLRGFAAAVLEAEGMQVRHAPRPEPDSHLWVVEATEGVREAASEFLRSSEAGRVIVLGGAGDSPSSARVNHVPEGLRPTVMVAALRRFARDGASDERR